MVEKSHDLSNWQTVPFDGVNATQRIADPNPDGDGSAELVEVRMRVTGEAEGFVRVRVGLVEE